MPAIESRTGNDFRRGHGPLLRFEAEEVLVFNTAPGIALSPNHNDDPTSVSFAVVLM